MALLKGFGGIVDCDNRSATDHCTACEMCWLVDVE